jgi:hypothetical protein
VSDFELALAHYRLLFPDLASLGAGVIPSAWKAEYDRIVSLGLSATLVTSTTFTGGTGGSGVRNFDQKILLQALHTRRGELDPAYAAAAFAESSGAPARRLGITVQL